MTPDEAYAKQKSLLAEIVALLDVAGVRTSPRCFSLGELLLFEESVRLKALGHKTPFDEAK
jgi:hypothetical protein